MERIKAFETAVKDSKTEKAGAMFKVAILDDYQNFALAAADWKSLQPEVEVQAFADNLVDLPRLAERLQPFDAVVLMRERTPFPGVVFECLPNLRLVVSTGVRNASIDLAAATERGVLVTFTDIVTDSTAELTWGLIIALLRHLPHEVQAMRNGKWQSTVGRTLRGKTLGILGLGKLGSQVANVGKAFGMEVIAWSENLTTERAAEKGVTYVKKEMLFEKSDVLTIHVLLSDRTRGLIGTAEFKRMKPTAYLVNTARAAIVDETALLEALRTKRIAGAAFDVYNTEPLPGDDPMRQVDNIVLTPHLGYVVEETYRLVYGQAVENIRAFLSGNPIRVMNKLDTKSESASIKR